MADALHPGQELARLTVAANFDKHLVLHHVRVRKDPRPVTSWQ